MFDHDLDAEKVALDQKRHVSDLLHSVKPREAVVEAAHKLSEKAPLAVASGGHRSNVDITLRAIGVYDLFRVIVTHEDVSRSKPSPEMFLLAAEKMGEEPVRCLVYEDSPTGIEAAKAAGMDWILVE